MSLQNEEPRKSISDVPEKRQSPRKRMTPIKDMKKNDGVRYSTHTHVGRSTGAAAFENKNIRLLPDGTENFEDYWTDEASSEASYVIESSLKKSSMAVGDACLNSSNEAENVLDKSSLNRSRTNKAKQKLFQNNEEPRRLVSDVSERRQSPRKPMTPIKDMKKNDGVRYSAHKHFGRRTGVAAFENKNIRLLPDGVENFEDYWTDEASSEASYVTKSSLKKSSMAVGDAFLNSSNVAENVLDKSSLNRSRTNKTKQKLFQNNISKVANENIGGLKTVSSSSKDRNRHYPQNKEPRKSVSEVLEKRQSPRKRMTPIKDMKKNDGVRYSTHTHVGRRTGAAAFENKNIRLLPDGTENFEDYWTDEASSEASYVTESSLAKSSMAVSEVSLNSSNEAEKMMLDKACSTSKNIEVSDMSPVSLNSKKNASVQRSCSAKDTIKESEKELSHNLSQSVLSNIPSPIESRNRSRTNKAKQKLFQNNISGVGNETIGEDSSHQHSQNISASKNSASKILRRSKIAKSKQFQDLETDDESENDGVVSSAAKQKNSVLLRSSKGKIFQNENPLQNSLQRTRSKLITETESEEEFLNIEEEREEVASTSEISKSTAKRSLNFSTSSVSRHKDIHESSKQRKKLIEYSSSEDEHSSIETTSSGMKSKELISTKNQYNSPRKLSLEKSFNTSGSFRNKRLVNEDLENKVEYDKTRGKKSVSFSVPEDKVGNSFRSSKPKSMLIEDSVSEEDSNNDIPSTSIRNTSALSSRSSQRKSLNVSISTRNKSNITEEMDNDVEFGKKQGRKSVSFQMEHEKIAKKNLKISQSKLSSSLKSTKPKSMLIEDSAIGENSDSVHKLALELASTSIRSTGNASSRNTPRKSHNVLRSAGNKINITEETENDIQFDNKQEKKSVPFKKDGEKTVQKISQSKENSSLRSSKPKSMLIEDSVSEDDSDSAYNNDELSTSIRRKGNVSSRSSPQKNPSKKISSVKSSKPKSMLIEDSVSEEDSNSIHNNDTPSTSIRRTDNLSSRSSPKKNSSVSRSIRSKKYVTGEVENDVKFDKKQEKNSVSFKDGEKIAKRVNKISQSKKTNTVRSSKPKSMLIEDSVSEEDSDGVYNNDAPSTSIRSTDNVLPRKSPRKSHNVSRSFKNKNEETKVHKNSLNKKTSSVRSSKPKSMLIEDSVSEEDSDSVHVNNATSSIKSIGNVSLRRSPRKIESSVNHLSKLIEEPVSDNLSENIDYGENASISRRFSPRKNSSRKYHSTPKSPINSNQLREDKQSSINENASVGSRSKTVSNMSRHISKIAGADSSSHGNRVMADKVIEEESRTAKDSGISSANDRSKNVPQQKSINVISQNNEANSQKSSARKSLKNKKRSTSRSSRKRSKLPEDVEIEEESADENEIIAKRSRISQRRDSRVSRSSKRNSKFREDNARDSANDFQDVARDSANEFEDVARGSDNEFGDISSPTKNEVGVSTHSPSGKAATTKNYNTTGAKKKNKALGNNTVDPSQVNELDINEIVPKRNASKTKKSKKKQDENFQGPLRRSDRVHVRPLAYWLGERIKTKLVDGIIVSAGINPGWKEDNRSHVKIQKINWIKKVDKIKKQVPKTTVLNPRTNEYVNVNLHRPFNFSQWSAVSGEDGTKVPYYLTKTFSSEMVTFGFLDICPLEVKSSQYSPNDNIHFIVQKGQVKVTIRKSTFKFEKYDSFIVPSTEAYSIENLGKSNALLSFCTFKIPFFPYQCNE